LSLVSDALRKARQESAERDGRHHVASFPSAMVHAGSRSRLGLGLVLGAVTTLVAAAGGGLAAWWFLAAHPGPTAATAGTSEVESGGPATPEREPAAAVGDSAVLTTANLAGTGPAATSPASAEPNRAAATATPGVTGEQPPGIAAPAPPAAETGRDATPAKTAPPPQRGRSPAAGPRLFVAEAHLGYADLVLDYIAYRPSDPFAQINGVELHEGYHLEGFTVERIGPDEVELRDAHGPLVLRVR
jgi:hypothetical protein